ncbi:probable RNA-binding protein EIF1AD [Rhopilema esculentum]|uniref:probable RNA-binding protein EIF1AD n=1 Tax=Rhopilema esculentum TaxID=499914 RepID=UPI0031E19E96|eukprot:gene2667-873_t
MSKTTKRKHVTKEALTEYYVPEGDEEIVKIIAGRGNNLHEVQTANGRKFLVSMPSKFRKNLWVKRGDYVVVNPIKEGNKVLAEIVYILYAKQIKYLQNEGLWPEQFKEELGESEEKTRAIAYEDSSENSDDDDDDELLFKNPNRREFNLVEDSESSSSEEVSSTDNEEEGEDESQSANKETRENNICEDNSISNKLDSISLNN